MDQGNLVYHETAKTALKKGCTPLSQALPTRQLPNWFPLALLCLTLLALFHRLLLGEVLFWGLPSLQFYPWREFAMSELAQGRLPLWNPFNGAGTPLLANYQSALLYPPHLLYWLWSGPQMMGYLGVLHLAWAGLGMWFLTGRYRLPALGRGIAALAFPLSSTLVARFGTFPMVDVAAWLPWLMLATDLLINQVTRWRVLALATVLAMQLLAGHAQWTFYSLVLAGGCAMWRVARERRRAIPIMAAGLVALALAVGIAAAQLVPTAELQRESQRAAGVDEDYALNFSYAPLSLITLFNPNFFGNPGDGSYAIGGAYFETAAYVGILPVVLAILGAAHFVHCWRRKRPLVAGPYGYLIPYFAIVTLIAFVLALGKFGIYGLLYRYVPTFNMFQAPARWLLLAVFSLSILAAFAVSFWKPTPQTRRRARMALIGAISITIAGIIASLLVPRMPPITLEMARGVAVLGALLIVVALLFAVQPADERRQFRWSLIVLLFVAADLWAANAISNPTIAPEFYDRRDPASSTRLFWPDANNRPLPDVAFERFLPLYNYRLAVDRQAAYRTSYLPNLNLLDRQPSLNSFEPLRSTGFERFMALINGAQRPALLRAAAVGQVEGQTRAETDVSRVWLVGAVRPVSNLDEAITALRDESWNPEQSVVVETTAAAPPLQLERGPGSEVNGTARIISETPLSIEIAVESPTDAMLVAADTYYPDWTATVDDQPATIYRANAAFRAVPITAGRHTVRMTYQPRSVATGAAISAAALAIYALTLVTALIRLRMRSAIMSMATRLKPPSGIITSA
jgi:hypothetical protein